MDELPDHDLVDALREENDSLRIRVGQLEAAANEYRRQMTEVLTSVSWRATSPLRGVAGKGRLMRRRAKALPHRLARRSDRQGSTPTTGLFPPVAPNGRHLVTAESPLLRLPFRSAAEDRLRPDPRPAGPRILVVAHVYYPEVWPDIEDRLARLPEAYDLIVTLVKGRAESLEHEINRRIPHARIHHVENYGRDLGPLIELAGMGLFEGYDAILKVHTKRSPHRLDGDAWRITLLDGVLPSPMGVDRILDLFRRDRDVGIVAPSGHIRGAETWGSDRELVEALAARFPFAFDPDALQYPAGSMYWARPWVFQRLADLQLTVEHFEPEADHLDGSTAHALERFVGVLATASGLDIVETDDVPSRLHRARRGKQTQPRVLAFYLPQFHRSPENDAWWGEGFTDWDNVAKAQPLYEGHRQPVEPGELGRYDLSDPDVLRSQAALAREYGVDGFVMHHYWFDGKPLLDTPLRNLLADPSIDFPFALCWANENWTRTWDGLENDVLIAQTYRPGWEDAYYDDILPALRDPRYIRVDGVPLLVVYRIGHVPRGGEVIEHWKRRAAADGLGGLHVLAVTPSRDFEGFSRDVGSALDGLVRFPPGSGIGIQSVAGLAPGLVGGTTGDVMSYDGAIDGADLSVVGPHGLRVHPGVMPGWDNTPRRGEAAYVFHGGNPVSFRRWAARAAEAAVAGPGEPLLFVNAWNEWAEGAQLEPDLRFGRANLEALRDLHVGRLRR
ncbi:MAG: glycoside hydrolase family 99-like domain-containing protein [Frankiaceae bacterium]|nr:glycoside hydrolase family 99-like domain-containing protein [Frankiaceae bacterium]